MLKESCGRVAFFSGTRAVHLLKVQSAHLKSGAEEYGPPIAVVLYRLQRPVRSPVQRLDATPTLPRSRLIRSDVHESLSAHLLVQKIRSLHRLDNVHDLPCGISATPVRRRTDSE